MPPRYAIVVFVALAGAACTGSRSGTTVQNEEQQSTPTILSSVRMSDPGASTQLVKGFYGLEAGAWRWTAGNFSVLLKTPPGAAQNGATLTFNFSVVDGSIHSLGKLRLAASLNGTELKSAEYNAAGAYMLTADIPASLLTGDTVTVDFKLDKTMRPPGDSRDLGVIASSVGLAAK